MCWKSLLTENYLRAVFLSLKDYTADGKVTKERIPSLRKLLTLLFNEYEGDYTILGLSS